MTLLANLNNEMRSKSVSADRISNLTGIGKERLRKIQFATHKTEPWFDEAVAIARILNVSGILQLVGVSDLKSCPDLPMPTPYDLDVWRSGVRLPLGTACNIAIMFGLTDPIQLVVDPLLKELWRIMATGERTDCQSPCPWCQQKIVGDAGHLDNCLPNNLMGGRGSHLATVTTPPRPPRKGQDGGSAPAYGLKALRERMQLTQKEMAARLGTDYANYPSIERCERPLTQNMAKRWAGFSNIDRALFYVQPVPAAPVPPAPPAPPV